MFNRVLAAITSKSDPDLRIAAWRQEPSFGSLDEAEEEMAVNALWNVSGPSMARQAGLGGRNGATSAGDGGIEAEERIGGDW